MDPDRFHAAGVALIPGVLSPLECEQAGAKVALTEPSAGGTRTLLSQPWCAALADRMRSHPALRELIGPRRVAVQCTYFEKSVGRNWLVPIHQDLSIPVAARVDDASLGAWSEKEGVLFVRPPLSVLDDLVAVRIHLDPCGLEDGPLRVVPGSHCRGLIGDAAANGIRTAGCEKVCLAGVGDALVIRPLLLHASSKGTGSGRRRILHFVFGPRDLPCGLSWALAV
jgi:hypothetical protein